MNIGCDFHELKKIIIFIEMFNIITVQLLFFLEWTFFICTRAKAILVRKIVVLYKTSKTQLGTIMLLILPATEIVAGFILLLKNRALRSDLKNKLFFDFWSYFQAVMRKMSFFFLLLIANFMLLVSLSTWNNFVIIIKNTKPCLTYTFYIHR